MSGDWSRYWRSADEPLEAMHAHFREHVYHRHSHDTYSFGVTESGAQSFTCRGAAYTSAAGMVMAFNPDDPHGHASTGPGVQLPNDPWRSWPGGGSAGGHRGPSRRVAAYRDPGPAGSRAGRRVAALHQAVIGPATPLERGELLTAAPGRAARVAARRPTGLGSVSTAGTMRIARRVRGVLDGNHADPVSGGYRRQLRLRAARRALARGTPPGQPAADAGSADQAHLTRWFRRCYGITPAATHAPAANRARPAVRAASRPAQRHRRQTYGRQDGAARGSYAPRGYPVRNWLGW